MGLKARMMKALMGSVGARQYQGIIEKETELTHKNVLKSEEDSPERFEIVFESFKYPSDKLKLFIYG